MSTDHGEILMQKPISEYAIYIKNLIPANIPETYVLKPMFENIASEENIRNGIIAFRDFLYLFCDRLISDGDLYVKPKKTKNPTDYLFLHNLNHLLIDIGNHSKLAESGDSLLVTEIPSFTAPKPKIPVSKQTECLRFLALCGFVFTGIDLEAKKLNISEAQLLEVSYPNNPILLTGLKALSIADVELRTRRYSNDDNLLRCDYRLIKAEDTDMFDVLKDFLHPLPEKLQKFALELHQRYIDMGMTCVTLNDNAVHFAYSYIKNSKRDLSTRDIYQQRVWEFYLSMKYGYCLFVRSKKTDKYADVIENFHLSLQEKIAQGYGCDRKLRNERCQGGCQGIRIPLDDSILEIKRDIEIWLDNELPSSLRS
ncbi:hypothetical protein [Tissierella sp.]|uniref:hypothetical protein n=1 Tax=Tissierella sp. TaxID=41274 RepID=UPI00285517E9|nr:hypothetical protein [Tissierella sp.]MDR7855205.1 hypothetical protein [Tissierella sp.]